MGMATDLFHIVYVLTICRQAKKILHYGTIGIRNMARNARQIYVVSHLIYNLIFWCAMQILDRAVYIQVKEEQTACIS
jgi:hypothetical protein